MCLTPEVTANTFLSYPHCGRENNLQIQVLIVNSVYTISILSDFILTLILYDLYL